MTAMSSITKADDHNACAAEFVWQLWQGGDVAVDFPSSLKPSSREQGYAIQAELDHLSGNTRAGWKIAATSAAGQRHIGVDGPLAGRIFAARLLAPGAETSLAANRMRVVEPEFAFRLGRTLQPRRMPYTTNEVFAAVESLHLALELPDSRFSDFASVGGPALIADNACAHELVLGPAVSASWRALDLSRHVVVAHVARRYSRDGVGSNVLGDPQAAMTWLVNELSSLGMPINAGEFVTTGTCMTPLAVVTGDQVTADFGTLGTISVRV